MDNAWWWLASCFMLAMLTTAADGEVDDWSSSHMVTEEAVAWTQFASNIGGSLDVNETEFGEAVAPVTDTAGLEGGASGILETTEQPDVNVTPNISATSEYLAKQRKFSHLLLQLYGPGDTVVAVKDVRRLVRTDDGAFPGYEVKSRDPVVVLPSKVHDNGVDDSETRVKTNVSEVVAVAWPKVNTFDTVANKAGSQERVTAIVINSSDIVNYVTFVEDDGTQLNARESDAGGFIAITEDFYGHLTANVSGSFEHEENPQEPAIVLLANTSDMSSTVSSAQDVAVQMKANDSVTEDHAPSMTDSEVNALWENLFNTDTSEAFAGDGWIQSVAQAPVGDGGTSAGGSGAAGRHGGQLPETSSTYAEDSTGCASDVTPLGDGGTSAGGSGAVGRDCEQLPETSSPVAEDSTGCASDVTPAKERTEVNRKTEDSGLVVEGNPPLDLQVNAPSDGDTATSANAPGVTIADPTGDLVKSIGDYANVVVNDLSWVNFDIPAIDYDAVGYDPSVATDGGDDGDDDDDDDGLQSRALFHAPRRQKGKGRVINGRLRVPS